MASEPEGGQHAATGLPRWVPWAFLLTGVGLVIGWPIAAIVNWHHIVDSHTRLGYLVGDLGLVAPLCFATGLGLRRRRPWARLVFMLTSGALAYDLIHFGIYLVQEDFLSVGVLWGLLCAAIVAVLAWLTSRALRAVSAA
jgi:hypothetical protein